MATLFDLNRAGRCAAVFQRQRVHTVASERVGVGAIEEELAHRRALVQQYRGIGCERLIEAHRCTGCAGTGRECPLAGVAPRTAARCGPDMCAAGGTADLQPERVVVDRKDVGFARLGIGHTEGVGGSGAVAAPAQQRIAAVGHDVVYRATLPEEVEDGVVRHHVAGDRDLVIDAGGYVDAEHQFRRCRVECVAERQRADRDGLGFRLVELQRRARHDRQRRGCGQAALHAQYAGRNDGRSGICLRRPYRECTGSDLDQAAVARVGAGQYGLQREAFIFGERGIEDGGCRADLYLIEVVTHDRAGRLEHTAVEEHAGVAGGGRSPRIQVVAGEHATRQFDGARATGVHGQDDVLSELGTSAGHAQDAFAAAVAEAAGGFGEQHLIA